MQCSASEIVATWIISCVLFNIFGNFASQLQHYPYLDAREIPEFPVTLNWGLFPTWSAEYSNPHYVIQIFDPRMRFRGKLELIDHNDDEGETLFIPATPSQKRRPSFLTWRLYSKMSTSGLKAIAPVPTAADFLDIVLSKTQRKTPTVCWLFFNQCNNMISCLTTSNIGHTQELQD